MTIQKQWYKQLNAWLQDYDRARFHMPAEFVEISTFDLEDMQEAGFKTEDLINAGLLRVVCSPEYNDHQAFGPENYELTKRSYYDPVGSPFVPLVKITLQGGELLQKSLDLLDSNLLNDCIQVNMHKLEQLSETKFTQATTKKVPRQR